MIYRVLVLVALVLPLEAFAEDLKPFLSADGIVLDIRASVTDEDLAQLSDPAFAKVTTVKLSSANVTDKGLINLKALPLEVLHVHYSLITDNGLKHLIGLPLKEIDLYGSTGVSRDGVAALRAAAPAVKITSAPE